MFRKSMIPLTEMASSAAASSSNTSFRCSYAGGGHFFCSFGSKDRAALTLLEAGFDTTDPSAESEPPAI